MSVFMSHHDSAKLTMSFLPRNVIFSAKVKKRQNVSFRENDKLWRLFFPEEFAAGDKTIQS
jgi:hypothetical protein